jgi:hypothetical protein
MIDMELSFLSWEALSVRHFPAFQIVGTPVSHLQVPAVAAVS